VIFIKSGLGGSIFLAYAAMPFETLIKAVHILTDLSVSMLPCDLHYYQMKLVPIGSSEVPRYGWQRPISLAKIKEKLFKKSLTNFMH